MPRLRPHNAPLVDYGLKTRISVRIFLQRSCEIQFSHHLPILHNIRNEVVFGSEALDWLIMSVAIRDVCCISAA